MNYALKEAQKAYNKMDVPVGCVIVYNGKIIARGYNKREKDQNVIKHAEIEAIDKACFFIAGIDSDSLLQAVECAVDMNRNGDHGIPVPNYVDENVSTKVVKIIQSYTGIVNKMVWRKF